MNYSFPVPTAPGNYTVRVAMTPNGVGSDCLGSDVLWSDPIVLTIVPETDPSCDIIDMTPYIARIRQASCPNPSTADGELYLRIDDGSGIFRYRVDNGPWVNLNRDRVWITGVAYGNHVVHVEDVMTGYTDAIEVFVGSSFGLSQQPVVSNPSCSGGDGAFNLKLAGGSGIYNVRVIDQASVQVYESLNTTEVDVVVNGLNSGTYSVSIEDAGPLGTCDMVISITLSAPLNCNNPCEFTVQAEPFAETCYSGIIPNGRVVFHVNPKGNYDYLLENATLNYTVRQNDTIFVNLKAGDYNYTIFNLTPGCNNTYDVGVVTVPLRKSTLDVTAQMISDVTCYNTPTGQARLTVVSGGAAPYYYSVDKGFSWSPFNSNDIVNDLPPNDDGFYNILVGDSPDDLCPAEVEIDIRNVHPEIEVTTTTTEASCNDDDGSFTITSIVGGLANYSVDFNGRSYNYTGSPLVFDDLQKGNKYFTVNDASGCAKPFEVFIGSPGLVYLESLTVEGPTCGGNGDDGMVTFMVDLDRSPISGQYFYGVAPRDVPQNEVVLQPFSALRPYTVYNLSHDDYYLLVSVSGDGCPNKYDFSITTGPKKVDFELVQKEDIPCNGGTGYIALSNFKGDFTQPFYYRIKEITMTGILDKYTGQFTVHRSDYTFEFPRFNNEPLSKGRYIIEIIQYPTECPSPFMATEEFEISEPEELTAIVKSVESSWEDLRGGSITIEIDGSGNGGYLGRIYYKNPNQDSELDRDWKESTKVPYTNDLYTLTFKNLPVDIYIIEVTDNKGCMVLLEQEVQRNLQLWIPNIFSPNHDGVNDTFYIRNLTDGSKLIIKNRWGKVVYENKDYRNDWDGGELADGIYFYQLSTGGQSASGWVEIFRGAGPRL